MKKTIVVLVSIAALIGAFVLAPISSASILDGACSGVAGNEICDKSGQTDATPLIRNIINILLYIVSVVSIIMIIVGGMRYILSSGDSGKVASAKNTVVYAAVGLIVAVFSWVIVNLVAEQLT